MFKAIALGISATTSLILVGAGSFVGGMLVLKGAQKLTEAKAAEMVDDMTRPGAKAA